MLPKGYQIKGVHNSMSELVYSHEVENMCCVAKGPKHGPAPIPEEGCGSRQSRSATFPPILTVWAGVHHSRVPASFPSMLRKVSSKKLSLKPSDVPV